MPTGPQLPPEHVPSVWQPSEALAHTVPSGLLAGPAHAPDMHTGASWQASGAVPQFVPSGFADGVAQLPPMHTGGLTHSLGAEPHGVPSARPWQDLPGPVSGWSDESTASESDPLEPLEPELPLEPLLVDVLLEPLLVGLLVEAGELAAGLLLNGALCSC